MYRLKYYGAMLGCRIIIFTHSPDRITLTMA